jgi:hypothetical protein
MFLLPEIFNATCYPASLVESSAWILTWCSYPDIIMLPSTGACPNLVSMARFGGLNLFLVGHYQCHQNPGSVPKSNPNPVMGRERERDRERERERERDVWRRQSPNMVRNGMLSDQI